MMDSTLMEQIKKSPRTYLGKTAKGEDVCIFAIDNAVAFAGISTCDSDGKKKLIVRDKDLIHGDIKVTFKFIFKEVFNDSFDSVLEVKDFSDVEIVEDYNNLLCEKGFKVLSENKVKTICSSLGFVYSASYTKVTTTIPTRTYTKVTRGLNNYDEIITSSCLVLDDKFKDYIIAGSRADGIALLDSGHHVCFYGPPATGKTQSIMAWCYQEGIPCYCVAHSAGMLVTDYTGTYRPNLEPGKIKIKRIVDYLVSLFIHRDDVKQDKDDLICTEEDGEVTISLPQFKYVLSAFTKAFMYGGIYIADEINAAPNAVLLFLNDVLVNGVITLPSPIDSVYQHKDFRFVATCNPGLAGTNTLNEAFGSRLVFVEVPALTSLELLDWLKISNPDYSVSYLSKLVEVTGDMNEICRNENSSHQITIRHLNNFLDSLANSNVKDKKQAFINCLFGDSSCTGDGDLFTDPNGNLYKTFCKHYKELEDLSKAPKDTLASLELPKVAVFDTDILDAFESELEA